MRQSDFCLLTCAYHASAYQDFCLSIAKSYIQTFAYHSRTCAYQKRHVPISYIVLILVGPNQLKWGRHVPIIRFINKAKDENYIQVPFQISLAISQDFSKALYKT